MLDVALGASISAVCCLGYPGVNPMGYTVTLGLACPSLALLKTFTPGDTVAAAELQNAAKILAKTKA